MLRTMAAGVTASLGDPAQDSCSKDRIRRFCLSCPAWCHSCPVRVGQNARRETDCRHGHLLRIRTKKRATVLLPKRPLPKGTLTKRFISGSHFKLIPPLGSGSV